MLKLVVNQDATHHSYDNRIQFDAEPLLKGLKVPILRPSRRVGMPAIGKEWIAWSISPQFTTLVMQNDLPPWHLVNSHHVFQAYFYY